MFEGFRLGSVHVVDADVYRIFDECSYACPPPKGCPSFGFDAVLIQILRYPVCPVSVIGQQIEDFLDNLGFIFIDHQIPYRLILFVGTALMLQLITIRKVPTPVLAFLYHLTMLGLNTNRSLFAFAGRLPEADADRYRSKASSYAILKMQQIQWFPVLAILRPQCGFTEEKARQNHS